MRYLLDTNAVIMLMRGNTRIKARLQNHAPNDFAISTIMAHELFYGAYKGQRKAENLARIDAFQFEALDFDHEDARCAGEIRALLANAGHSIGPYDVLVAGQALARSLVLITHNTGEFRRVPGLTLEDWEM